MTQLNSKGKLRKNHYDHPGRPFLKDGEKLTHGINVRLNKAEYKELQELCFKDGQSLTAMGRVYFRKHLRKLRKKYK